MSQNRHLVATAAISIIDMNMNQNNNASNQDLNTSFLFLQFRIWENRQKLY